MAKTMQLTTGPTSVTFDDVNGLPRRPDFHNRLARRAEDGTLYISIFGQKLLVETTVVMPEADKDFIHAWHARAATLTFYDKFDAGTASSYSVKLLGQTNPGTNKWTKVGGWYTTRLRIAEL